MAELKTVGVVGSGQMGNGIAHVCALAGYNVILNDLKPATLRNSFFYIDTVLPNRN